MVELELYQIPIEDIRSHLKKIENSYIPRKKWEPITGEKAVMVTPVKVFKDKGDFLDVMDSDGSLLKVSRKELFEYNIEKSEINMKAMKDAVLKVAKDLLKANNTVTTLEIKTELRRDYPYYYWTQQLVSDYMAQFAGDGVFSYTDNGTFRTYSLATPTQVAVTTGPVTKSLVVSNQTATGLKGTIDLNRAIGMSKDSTFESVEMNRRGTIKTYTADDIRKQKKSPYAYLSRSRTNVVSVTVAGKKYVVR